MKILLISFEYPIGRSYCGGVGQIVKQSRDALRMLGHEVYVLISSEFQKKHAVKVLFPDGSLLRYPHLGAFQKQYAWDTFECILQHFVNWTKEFKKLKENKKRPKILYHFHSILRREKDAGFKTLNSFLLNQEKMIELADRIICPSRYEYDNFTRYFPYFSDKVRLVENTIETVPYDTGLAEDIRRDYVIKNNDIVSLYVGRLEKIKGAQILIKYLPEILEKHPNLKMFIIGKTLEQYLYRKLRMVIKQFPSQLFYIPYMEKTKLYHHYYISDIYVNPSLSESFSLSTHESALCNTALLLSPLPVFDKFREAALFFSPQGENGDRFLHRFEELIRDRNLREKLSRKSVAVARCMVAKKRLMEEITKVLYS